MATSQLVELNVIYYGQQYIAAATSKGIDLDDIMGPVIASTKAGASSSFNYRDAGSANTVQQNAQGVTEYHVTQTLSQIEAMSEDMVLLTVVKRGAIEVNAQVYQSVPMIFRANKFTGPLQVAGTGTKFYYYEGTAAEPVFYQVTESISTIIGSITTGNLTGNLTTPYIPYATSATNLADSPLSRVDDSGPINIAVDLGTSFRSHLPSLATIGFSASGDEVLMTTDGGGMAESYAHLTPTQLECASVDGSIVIDGSSLTANHTTQISLNCADIMIPDSVNIHTTTPAKAVLTFLLEQINLSTDGDPNTIGGNAGWLYMDATQVSLSHNTNGSFAEIRAGNSNSISFSINHTSRAVNIASESGPAKLITLGWTAADVFYPRVPLTQFADNAAMDVDTLNGTYTMFNTNASVINFGRSGGVVNLSSTLFMQGSELQLASSTTLIPSINIPAGVAPTTPADGDIWYSGNELLMYQNATANTILAPSAVTTEVVLSDTTLTVLVGGNTYKILATLVP